MRPFESGGPNQETSPGCARFGLRPSRKHQRPLARLSIGRARTLEDWRKWLSPSATFVLETTDGPEGIAAGVPDANDPAVVRLMAMWVHPALRGSGAASALVQAVLTWAEARGASSVRLDVIDRNDRARRLYERYGFQATGHIARRPRDGAREVQMERRVGNGAPE